MTETAQDRPSAVPSLPGGRAGPGEEDAIRSEIRGEQLRLLFKADLPVAFNVVNGLVTVAVLWPVAPPQALLAWISAMALVCLARIALGHAYLRRDREAARDLPWATLHAIGSGVTGLLWGATALAVLSVDEPVYHLFVGLVAAGTSAGALSANFPYIPSFLAYVVPYVGPMALAFLIHGGAAYSGVGVLMLAFIGLLGVIVRNFNATFLESVRLRTMLGRTNAELEARVAERTAALRDSESRLRAIFDNAPECVFLGAPDGTVLEINAAGVSMIEAARADQVIGKTVYEFIDAQDNPAVRGIVERGFRGDSTKIELTVTTMQGNRRWWEIISVPLSAPGGTVSVLLGIARDLTESRAMEAQLRQAQKMEAIGQLTGGIAHDFNNLLSVIVGNLELMLERAKTDPVLMRQGQAALKSSLQGAELIRQLLVFSRKQSLQPRVIDLGDRLVQISALLQRTLGEQIAVEIRPADGLWPVVADPSQMDNAVLNLALNARDAMPGGGTITIEVANLRLAEKYHLARKVEVAPGDYVLLTVRDNGIGMPPDVLDRVFEPFFTTKGVGKGSGLGLSMVYGFVKQSGGYIEIESEVGRGTAVKIYLPRGEPAAVAEEESANRAASPLTGIEVILVVEDNEDVRTVVMTQLADLGYRTLEAEGAAAALAMLDKHPEIDLMFSDMVMRGSMNGYELAREARERRPDLKILLTSGYEMNAVAQGAGDAAGFELLKKPYRMQDLAHKLRQALTAE